LIDRANYDGTAQMLEALCGAAIRTDIRRRRATYRRRHVTCNSGSNRHALQV
jgi:hypothetical protein